MTNPTPSTSSGVSKETNLDLAKEVFEKKIPSPRIDAEIVVRRRKRGKAFVAEDILFEIQFRQSSSGNLPLLSVVVSVYHVLKEIVEKLKGFYDDKKRRLAFFSSHVDQMTSSIYSGGRSIHEEPI